jgi:RND family efflux transporter MFP subunit
MVQSYPTNTSGRFIKALRIALVLIISVAVAAFLIKMRPRPMRQKVQHPPVLVETIEVEETTQNMIIRNYGTVRSGETLDITAEVRGTIVEMASSFEEGDYFPKGAFLMRIDPRSYRLTVDRLVSDIKRLDAEISKIRQERSNLQRSLDIAKEDLQLAESEYARNRSLAKRKVVSQTQLDQIRQRWLTSRQKAQEIENAIALIAPRINLLNAQRSSALTQIQQARLDLERTEISAPFDCRVAEKKVETGQYVSAGTRIASIYNVGIMEVEVRIPPRDIVWLHFRSGESVTLKGDPPASVRITFDAGTQTIQWDGFVARIKGQMEEKTRTLPVVVEIENGHPDTGHPLMPGMFVEVEIVGKAVKGLFLLPQEAVHEDNTVYTIEDEKVRIKAVNVLRRVDNLLYVNKGLEDGDRVITRFPGIATEGMKVRIRAKSDRRGESG